MLVFSVLCMSASPNEGPTQLANMRRWPNVGLLLAHRLYDVGRTVGLLLAHSPRT